MNVLVKREGCIITFNTECDAVFVGACLKGVATLLLAVEKNRHWSRLHHILKVIFHQLMYGTG